MTILQSLDRYYERMAARGEALASGWSNEPVGTVIVLTPDGLVVDVTTRLDSKGKKPQINRVPKPFNRQGTGSTPYLFWDNTAYALGVSEKDPAKTARDHAASRKLHLDLLADAVDPAVVAVRRFFERWQPDMFVAPFEPRMLAWNLTFRLDDGRQTYVYESAAAQPIIESFLAKYETEGVSSQINQCLITGRMAKPRTLHTKIKGMHGTSNPEVPFVSFNQEAFESYGKKQAENAPVSSAAVARYTAALTGLLSRSGANRLRRGIGDATVVFWADTSETVNEEGAAAAEDAFNLFAEPEEATKAADDDNQEAAKIGDALKKVADALPVEELGLNLVPGTRFHVLGLAPNAARLSVRYWLSDTIDMFVARLGRHYQDLKIEPRPRGWGVAPPVGILLVRTTALQGKFENIPPQLAGEVTRAVLSGAPYPRSWLAATIIRLRAGDDPGAGWHAAAIKACLNRIATTEKEKLPVALDPDRTRIVDGEEEPDVAYHLGRLFAVLESAQRSALGKVNASIRDRYYAAASATPANVFGALFRGLNNHITTAHKRGHGSWIEPRVKEIVKKLPPDLPRTLRLEEQGRFAIGYYHERGNRPEKKTEEQGE